MTYKPFAIVVVPFPFTEKEHSKRRPALVLSSVEHQQSTQHITLLMITSAKNSVWSGDCNIRTLEGTGLSAASVIRQKIFTLDSRLILTCVGQLANVDRDEVIKQLKAHLDL